jgi:DNA repair protein REV1
MAYKSGRDYVLQKRLKLNQSSTAIQQTSTCPQIFQDKTFFINGFISAEHTFLELKLLIVKHGGKVQAFLGKNVNFIIATAMTDAKIKTLKKIVLKPSWIWESIKQNKMLNVNDHLLFRVDKRQKLFPDDNLNLNIQIEGSHKSDHKKTKNNAYTVPALENKESSEEILMSIESSENGLELEFAPKNSSLKYNKQDNLCTTPTFIKDFFNQSRLHHLTSWKYKLINFISEKMFMTFKNETKKITETSVILHIDMDCFFVSVMLRDRQDLVDKPVGICS